MNIHQINNKLINRKMVVLQVKQGINTWKTRLFLSCKTCNHKWDADLHGVLYGKKRGCPTCAMKKQIKRITKQKHTKQEIDNLVSQKNPTIKRVGHYINISTKIQWSCKICNYKWFKPPSDIIHNQHGCPRCSKRERVTNQLIDKRLKEQHRNFIRLENSQGSMIPITWKCNKCDGLWKAKPNDIFSFHKSNCPYCSKRPYSKLAITWLKYMSEKNNINIQHAGNGNEFTIPNTRYKVDGFCKETNTVYEFHGDKFHGNPNLFNSNNKCHPYDNNITAGKLLKQTKLREEKIKKLGYNLIIMWECDWKRQLN